MADLIGREIASTANTRTQVYQATHKGENYLPFMNRSFISFSYGGKNIEDFNLLATIEGDRLQRQGYANFEDLATTYDALPGVYYWGTYFHENNITFNLSTDELTQRELDEFVYWFKPGIIRELILAEHPNRAIMARVAQPPQISMLPFEKKITVPFGDGTYQTSTTLYRGDITLELTMDEPHWYSKRNILGYSDDEGIFHDTWVDANGNTVSVYDDPDAIKIAYEDGIPFSSTLETSMLLGDNTLANVDYHANACIATLYEYKNASGKMMHVYVTGATATTDDELGGSKEKTNTIDDNSVTEYQDISYTVTLLKSDDTTASTIAELKPWPKGTYVGVIAGPILNSDSGVISLQKNENGENTFSNDLNSFIYYSGNAPSPAKLRFDLTPQIDSNLYIITPRNEIATPDGKKYNTITIESSTKQNINFTTPDLYTSYNKAMLLLDTFISKGSLGWPDLRNDLRKAIYHSGVRNWMATVIDCIESDSLAKGYTYVTESDIVLARQLLSKLIQDFKGNCMSSRYEFNSKTGKALGYMRYRKPTGYIPAASSDQWKEYGDIIENLEALPAEDVGDMLKSNYLIIQDRNYPDSSGRIQKWSPEHPEYAHRLYHDVDTDLENITLWFKNMYL